MNRVFTASFAGLALCASGLAQAATVVPAFDLSGTWQPAGGGTASYYQEGTQFSWINTSTGYSHILSARYIAPKQVQGIQNRVNRATGCSTEMLVTLTATDVNTVSISAKALDSSCDLVKGQIYTDTASRIQ